MEENFLWENFLQLLKKKTSELENQQKGPYRKPETPKLVLSVIGDSKSFVPKPWLASVFKQGLIATAKGAKDCFILYKGSSEKVSSIVREAVEDFSRLQSEGDGVFISLLGILPEYEDHAKHYRWDYWQEKHSDCILGEIYDIRMEKKKSYAEFHASILKGIIKNKIYFMTLEDKALEWNVPVLTIVAEGDLDTIEAVKEVLKQDLPILIIKGSGKASDFLAEFIEKDTIDISEYIKDKTPLLFGISSHDLMKSELDSKGSDSNQRNDLMSNMEAIKQNKCLITIIDINKQTQPKQFTDAVTKAIIRGWSRNKSGADDNIYSFDLIKQEGSYGQGCIDNDTYSLPVESKTKERVNPTAVSTNAICGTLQASNRKFMNSYKKILTPSSLPLYYYIAYQFIQEMQGEKTVIIENFNMLLKEAIVADRDEYVSVLLEEEGVHFNDNYFPAIYEWGSSPVIHEFKEFCISKEKKKDSKVYELTTIEVCMIAGRQICQALLGYPRVCALLASSVYKRMAASANDQATKSDMVAQSRLFADRALDLQSRLYDDDAELAMDLVLTEHIVWDITISPMQCAYEHDMLDVLAQTCPQRCLNKIWYSGISSSLGGFWKVFFFGALVCYSAFLLEMDVYHGVESIGFYEKAIYLYLVGDIFEEYRNLFQKDAIVVTKISKSTHDKKLRHSRWYRLKKYLFNFWNILDVLSYTLTIVAIFVRVFRSTKTNKTYRRFFSMSLFAMYMRFLHVLLMSRKIGPKIIMIKEMLKDLFRFIGILFVFMIGVGVLYHANMYPQHEDMWTSGEWRYWRIWKIIYIPYWQIYGEPMLEQFEANSTTPCTTIQSEWESNPAIERCNEYDWILVVITALYMLISNLLLVNLLIAVFSYRFERVQEISEKLWRYLRYEVIMDYRTRIPAPLNLVIRPIYIAYRCIMCIKNQIEKDKEQDDKAASREYGFRCM
ncbi:Hypothetical predicted protein [Mytilus galloprovincialis]|uniref:Uncharacterized protein n=1 Tax=Mytilus galloprovincialis TaxID=29158 RepID=A0A8B6D0P7_MYTGA|nr:Hypothetical predicted protein [Mytilus galloprovincialis]